MVLLIALTGALTGFGLVMLYAALTGSAMPEIKRQKPGQLVGSAKMENLAVRVALAVVGGLVIMLLTVWPVLALMAAGGGFMAPTLLASGATRKAKITRVEAIAAWAEMLRDTMAGAGGLEQSIIASAGIAPAPIRQNVVRLAARLERDRLTPALRAFADELDDPIADLVVAALVLAADKNPRKLGELLGTLSKSARAEVTMRLRIDAGRARIRTSVKVVAAVTAGVVALMVIFNRDYMEPYDSLTGQLVLATVAGFFAGSFYWLVKGSRFKTHDRFLTAPTTVEVSQ